MNNETNRDAEAFERHLLDWMLQAPIANTSSEDDENLNPPPRPQEWGATEEDSGVEYWEWDEPDPLDYQVGAQSNAPAQPQTIGEIPTVQDRFQTLLKQRLEPKLNPTRRCSPGKQNSKATTTITQTMQSRNGFPPCTSGLPNYKISDGAACQFRSPKGFLLNC